MAAAWPVKMIPQMEKAQPSGVIGVGRASLICTQVSTSVCGGVGAHTTSSPE